MSWNEPGPGRDPWNQGSGDKRGNKSPFDIDKLLKRVKGFFGKKQPGRHGPSSGLIGLIVAIAVALWLLSGFYTVDAQQRAIVMTFGAVTRVAAPGLGWRPPWPIGSIEFVNVTKIRQTTSQNSLMTKDRNLVDVGLTVQFRVSSARQYLFGVADPDDTLAQAARSALRSVVAGYPVDAVLGDAQKRIAAETRSQLQKTLNGYHCGIKVTDVSLSQVQPPKQVQDAFADAIKAGNDAAGTQNDAQAYAQDRLPRAQGEAAKEVAAARAYKDGVVADAKGQAARFDALLAEYRKAPQATRQRMYFDTMRTILGRAHTIIVDPGSGANINLNVQSAAPVTASSSDDAVAGPGVSTPTTVGSEPDSAHIPPSRSRKRGSAER